MIEMGGLGFMNRESEGIPRSDSSGLQGSSILILTGVKPCRAVAQIGMPLSNSPMFSGNPREIAAQDGSEDFEQGPSF